MHLDIKDEEITERLKCYYVSYSGHMNSKVVIGCLAVLLLY